MTDQEIYDWFHNAKAGDRLIYHNGYLARDLTEREVEGIAAIRALYDKGHLLLTQKRHGKFFYEYQATVRRNVVPIQPGYRFADLPVVRKHALAA